MSTAENAALLAQIAAVREHNPLPVTSVGSGPLPYLAIVKVG